MVGPRGLEPGRKELGLRWSTLSNYLYGVTIDPWQPPKEKPPVGHLNENAILRILLLNHFGDTVIYQPAKSLISRT